MTCLTLYNRKVSLQTKIDALDLFKSGLTIAEISRKLKFSKNSLYYWLNKEELLRKEYNELCKIQSLINENNLTNHMMEKLLQENLNNIKNLHRKKKASPATKLKCIHMVENFNSKSFVSQKTGYNHSLIGKWIKNKKKIELSLMKSVSKNQKKISKKTSYEREKRLYALEDQINGFQGGRDKFSGRVNNFKLNQPLIHQVKDTYVKQYLNFRHKKIDLQKKIDVLDMIDKGVDILEISRFFSLSYSTISYWRSISLKLRQEALLVQESINQNWNSLSAKDYRKSVLYNLLKINCVDRLSMETKLVVVQLHFCLNSLCSFEFLGEILGLDRNIVRNFVTGVNQMLEKYELRQSLRKLRLNRLLNCTYHEKEIKKLTRLEKSDNSLDILGSFLTYGVTYSCPRFPFKKQTVLNNMCGKRAKRKIGIRIFKKESKDQTSIELRSLFRELYQQEYELLYLIDERYVLLLDQISFASGDQKITIRSFITDLKTQLSQSIKKLIALHYLLIV